MFVRLEEILGMKKIIAENKIWIDDMWNKIENKLSVMSVKLQDKIPNAAGDDGIFSDNSEHPAAWTNGFWPGMMWLMYIATKDEKYATTARYAENVMDKALFDYKSLYHDVGFMWHISAGMNYRLTGSEKSKNRNLMAAATLASRFNSNGNFIRAWNDAGTTGWAIIDCMLNLPLLYWASKEIDDPRFYQIAVRHADKAMESFIRPDGSVYHVVEFDPENGEVTRYPHTQGYEPNNSSWTRGQAWAIYGFILSYIHTGKQEYLDTAKRVAHYFISAVCTEGFIPKCDFRSPDEPDYIDTSAGSIAACGLIEIAKVVPEYEQKLYIKAAIEILKAIGEEHCDFSLEKQGIVQNAMGFYKQGKQLCTTYGDYFFVEAFFKLKGNDFLPW